MAFNPKIVGQIPGTPVTPPRSGITQPGFGSLPVGTTSPPKPQTLGQPPIGTGGFTPGWNGIGDPRMQVTPSPQTQTFSPGSNLIGSQFNPTPSARGQNAAGMTDKAANFVSGFGFSPFKEQTANTGQSQGIYDNLLKMAQSGGSAAGGGGGGGAQLNMQLQPLLDKVTNAPDRGQLASDIYGVLEERARPGFEGRLRSVSQRAGALGRTKMGLTTNDLTDVESQHNQNLDLSRRQLAAEGAGYSLDDRLKQLNAAKDVYGSVSAANSGMAMAGQRADQGRFDNLLTLGRDLYGRESDQWGRGVGERDASLGYEQTRFGNERSKLGDMSAYESDIYGRDRNDREEMRGERGYQYGLERDALGDQERQWGMQEDAYGNDWQRAMQAAQFGYGTNPAAAVRGQGAEQAGQAQSTMETLNPLFLEWARRNRGGAAQPPQQQQPYNDSAV